MKLNDMQALFVHELRDLYSAEKQLTKALPKMAKHAADERLKRVFEDHARQTEDHVRRIEQILAELDESAGRQKCKGMAGLVEEGEELLKGDAERPVLDAALIGAAQRAEHYEIAAYGTARTYARDLGLDSAAALLQQTLDEEAATDRKLTELAESVVNRRAERR